MISRNNLYRFPWSKTDNAGGWVEVTDKCNLDCTGCYRHRIEGHRSLTLVKEDIDDVIRFTNCDSLCIAGGEPFYYPEIVDVVEYIASKGVKPFISSNGALLTPQLAKELRNAGLAKIHFHIDSTQNRPDWEGKSEVELNELRQYFADMLWRTKKIQCGYHVTVTRSSLQHIPEVLRWAMKNIKKVQHISFLAFRSVPKDPEYKLMANGHTIDYDKTFGYNPDPNEINITTEELYQQIVKENSNLRPSAYLNGTTQHWINKFLIIVNVASSNNHLGVLGRKTMELSQSFYHFMNGRYFSFLKNPNPGKLLFFASLFDKEVRKTFGQYLKYSIKNPARFFDRVYMQSIHLQQPSEVVNGEIDLCDDCGNLMVYKGQLIKACRLDEYRMFGGPMEMIKQSPQLN